MKDEKLTKNTNKRKENNQASNTQATFRILSRTPLITCTSQINIMRLLARWADLSWKEGKTPKLIICYSNFGFAFSRFQ